MNLSVSGNVIVLPIPSSYWKVPPNLPDIKTWHMSDTFALDYYLMGRWRMTFAFEFAKSFGYHYQLQMDDDTFIYDKIRNNLVYKMATGGYSLMAKPRGREAFKWVLLGLPELAAEWLQSNGINEPKGSFLSHFSPSTLKGATTNSWDLMISEGNFMLWSINVWYSDEVQDFLSRVFQTNYDITRRWQEQGVQNMIALMFINESYIDRISTDIVGHGAKSRALIKEGACFTPDFLNSSMIEYDNQQYVNTLLENTREGHIMYKNYVVFESSYGLANRLRVLASAIFLAKHKYNVSSVIMVWDINSHQNFHFLDAFEKIPNVYFISQYQKRFFEKNSVYSQYNSWRTMAKSLEIDGFAFNSTVESSIYRLFKIKKEFTTLAHSYVTQNRICDLPSLHLRNFDKAAHKFDIPGLIFSLDKEIRSVFVLADSKELRERFVSAFGGHVYTLDSEEVEHSHSPWRSFDANSTMIELVIAAHSKHLIIPHVAVEGGSSFTELILTLQRLSLEDKWCDKRI